MRLRRVSLAAPVALACLFLLGCAGADTPASDDRRGAGDGRASFGSVNPDTCGSYAASDAGRKLYAFLQATMWLKDEVHQSEASLHDTCQMMASELGMPQPVGDTRQICNEMRVALDESLEAGLSARHELVVDHQPAVCEVSVDAAAHAAAACEGRGHVDGVAECHGTCEGYADVNADASCQAHAEVRANTEATCTEPEVRVSYGADTVADTARLEAALAAIDVGLPRLLAIHARATGPVSAAFATWADTATNLAAAGMDAVRGLGDSAVCVGGQLAAAAAAIASIEASISMQVEVSASASASGSIGGES